MTNTEVKMISIPAGSFLMGSCYSDEGPQHQVTLESFQMSQFPITQVQWQAVMGTNPSYFQGQRQPNSDHCPVEMVSWHDAMEFCRRLSGITGKNYTLPSEAQWEYACRAGTTTPFHFGETISSEQANYDRLETTPVGTFPANDWGLHDMHGNVWEWCLDDYHENYEGAPADGSAWVEDEGLGKSCAAAPGSSSPRTAAPLAATTPGPTISSPTLASVWPVSESLKLLRGGSWLGIPGRCRSASRLRARPVNASYYVGFRVVCLPQD
jgi:formylglycine-generating enzyme required for sulfatase activity